MQTITIMMIITIIILTITIMMIRIFLNITMIMNTLHNMDDSDDYDLGHNNDENDDDFSVEARTGHKL